MPLRFFAILIIAAIGVGCSATQGYLSVQPPENSIVSNASINLNTASLDELQRIPHIGEKVAAKIIEHREVNGPFRRIEHLMLISGISDARFRKIRPMVRVE